MCGIAGIFSKSTQSDTLVKKMVSRIRHRGPDYSNVVYLFDEKVWLGHARLSIIDLSDAGNQPMSYLNDRYYLTYNGEVYNYLELRNELQEKGYFFKTNSDSEVILAAYAHWGEKCVDHFNGMFAFVIVDVVKRTFFVARDRFGVKPLYYWNSPQSQMLCISSEIKAFVDLPGWKPQLNGQRAYDYLNYGLTDHTNETMIQGVFQLRGGECITGTVDNPIDSFRVVRWYHPPKNEIKISEAEAAEEFRDLFFDSVKLRLRSDVKIGSCLSGGLDSSSIACTLNDILKETGDNRIQNTVSARAEGTSHDESKYIDIVLKERKINGFYVDPSPEELWEIQNKLIWYQDEPFGSTSIYAGWCVFEKAKKEKLKVMLDGQGADELLIGYKRFFLPYYAQLFKSMRWRKLSKEMQKGKEYHNHSSITLLKGLLKTSLPTSILNQMTSIVYYRGGFEWFSMDKIGAEKKMPPFFGKDRAKTVAELSDHLLLYNNLPELLRYEDRNTMAHSVESRLPFLDYRIVEFVQSLPDDYKISDGKTKAVLRNAMVGVLPESIRMRMDKIGFETPEEKWEKEHPEMFRRLIELAIEKTNGMINEEALQYFDRVVAGGKLDFTVWRMINFGIWYDMFINGNLGEDINKLEKVYEM